MIHAEEIKNILEKRCYLTFDKNDCAYEDIHIDRDDELSKEDILNIIAASNPQEYFYEYLDQLYLDQQDLSYYYYTVYDYYEFNEETIENQKEEIKEWIQDHVYYNVPYDNFLNKELNADVIIDVDSEEWNYCHVFNNFASLYYGNNDIDREGGLYWLIRQQGYRAKHLYQVMKDKRKSKFLESIIRESENIASNSNALCFCIKITLKEYMLLIANNISSITLSKDTVCGLYDFYNGSGSLFDIKLIRDVIIPRKHFELRLDSQMNYSLNDIYGFEDSVWQETLIKKEMIKWI